MNQDLGMSVLAIDAFFSLSPQSARRVHVESA